MVESLEPAPKPSLEVRAKKVLENGEGYGDAANGFLSIRAITTAPPSWWSEIKPAPTFSEYIAQKCGSVAGLAEAVVSASNPSFVEAYDTYVKRINEAIGQGVATPEQAEQVRSIIDEAAAFIRTYCETHFGQSGDITGGKET